MTHLLLLPGLLALLYDPARWLVHTWTDPAYASDGALVALLALGLAAKSVASGPARADAGARRRALGLLAATCAIRLVGRLLDVDHIGALALALDATAGALLLGLDRRPWPAAPWAVGGLAALSLPVEHALQQLVSYPLRIASASAAAALLWPLGIERQGTVLADASGAVLQVEVACSGATGLVALSVLALVVAARRELGWRAAACAAAATVGGALLANTARLVLLVVGPTDALLEQPAHTVVGLVALALGCAPVVLTARRLAERAPAQAVDRPEGPPLRIPRLLAASFSALAIAVARAPARPLDVSGEVAPIGLPYVLGPWVGADAALTELERTYYGRFGGRVERRVYGDAGPQTVLVVRTAAPVRHLHSPAACLRGAGHAVEQLGLEPPPPELAGEVPPTVVWRTVDADGRAWRVRTSFVSAAGQTADSASEVAWRWLARPGVSWTLLERVSPWEVCEADPALCWSFDRQLVDALELAPARSPVEVSWSRTDG